MVEESSASRPSHENAAEYLDKAIELCRGAGFKSIRLRGDTDFSQTAHLDRWDSAGDVTFLFGIDAMANLKLLAESLDKSAWTQLQRPARYEMATEERAKPKNVKEKVIAERGFKHLRMRCEHVAEIEYRPGKCARPYRLVICRKAEMLWSRRLGVPKACRRTEPQLLLSAPHRTRCPTPPVHALSSFPVILSSMTPCRPGPSTCKIAGCVDAVSEVANCPQYLPDAFLLEVIAKCAPRCMPIRANRSPSLRRYRACG